MPVLETLDLWPTLPIVVHYRGTPALNLPFPDDEDDIMAALTHSDRVSSISLTVTSSLLEKLSAVERPFSELEDLDLMSRNSMRLTLPSTFRWGPRLRTLHVSGLAIPALSDRLSPSTGLVSLQLHHVDVRYLSPDTLANALYGLTQLEILSLHFLSFTPLRNDLVFLPRSGERVVLLALTCLKYRGSGEYLDHVLARTDAPRLGHIDIMFFSLPTVNYSQLGRFIDRIEMQKSHRRAEILSSERAISISFTQPEAPTRLELQVSCKILAWQLSYIGQICNSLSPFLLGVEHLQISSTQPSRGQDYSDRKAWLKLIRPFRATKWVHVAGDQSTNIVLALNLPQYGLMLPALHKLCVRKPEPRYSPLQEAAVSLIHSRRVSGHMIGVEYERLPTNEICGTGITFAQCQFAPHTELLGAGPFSQQVSIEVLPDEVLLNIFRLFLYSSPQFWPTLTHVSRKWRYNVFSSPLGLNLRLYCTYGTPVSKSLDCWPALPIVVRYGGAALDRPASEEENIVAALKHSDRVSSIDLTITSSLQQKLFAIKLPFSELEELVLRSLDNVQLTLPSSRWWDTRLRRLHSTRVAFPALPKLLSPSTGLVDLQLHEIPNVGYFSPEAFAKALSEITQLETLSLHFLSFPPRRSHLSLPPQSGERIFLPALSSLKYRGTSKYLDNLVARIDAPRLGNIDITFFSQPTMDASQLGQFVERIKMQTSLSRAKVLISELAISIFFTSPSRHIRLELRIPCKQPDWQLSSIAQICDHLSPFTYRVEDLCIYVIRPSSMQGNMDHEQWLRLIHSFRGVERFYADDKTVTNTFCALDLADGGYPTVLPSLRALHVFEPEAIRGPTPVQSFTISRQLSGRTLQVYARDISCNICSLNFTEQQELKKHLVVMHAHRLVCPYCSNFEFSPRYCDLFQEHLSSKHHDAAQTDTLILSPRLKHFSPSSSGSHGAQKNDLHASVNFGAFTKFKAPHTTLHETATDIQKQLDTVIHFLPPSDPIPLF